MGGNEWEGRERSWKFDRYIMEDGKLDWEGQNSSSSTSSSLSYSGLLRLKGVPDGDVMSSIQVAVEQTVTSLELEPERDLLIQDFMTFESSTFRTQDSVDFKFHNYAPIAFKYFRRLFQIKSVDFLRSVCSEKLRQLENSGSSGSVFFLTNDDEYILKTAQQREGEFLLKLLPGYYLNLTQNPRTLLPKFFGFYCYNGSSKSIRIVVMNNLIPSDVSIDRKYDLKGSTARRKATQQELKKAFPTYKDLDFVEHYPGGLLLDPDVYAEFAKTLQRDCRVLESFKIIDYSLLLAIHYVKKNAERLKGFPSGIPARTTSGEELILFIGIIDILQSYQFRKKMEHALKSIIYEKDSMSVHRPDFYSQRFQNFIVKTVLRPTMSRRLFTLPSVQQVESAESSSSDEKHGKTTSTSFSLSWISWRVREPKMQQPVTILTDNRLQITFPDKEGTDELKNPYTGLGEEKNKGSDAVEPEILQIKEGNGQILQVVSKIGTISPSESFPPCM